MNTETAVDVYDKQIIKLFQPKQLLSLFFQPKQFFLQSPHYHYKSILLIAYLIGVVGVMDRIDQQLLRAEFGSPTAMVSMIQASWWNYWLWVLGLGFLGAALIWLVQGWWYKVRLQFSGATHIDPQLARQVFVLQSFVYVLPILIITLIQTKLYTNYLDAFSHSSTLSLVPIPFLFLSCWVSYRGATVVFKTNGWAKFWFLGLPVIFYLFIAGLFAMIMG
ncbi:hypothetical protein [Acinetobacter haemolyticus]|uniref:hypothetical protein n=1 Tax=Acinetobacter haemolyticus TaxID=29430 RepID=UPI000D6890A3|nr:hypothetical protein [Acinetobacter haemolyticus]